MCHTAAKHPDQYIIISELDYEGEGHYQGHLEILISVLQSLIGFSAFLQA